MSEEIKALSDRVDSLETNLQENTDATKRIEANTAELVEFFTGLRGAFKVLQWIGALAKPLGYIAALVAGVVGAIAALKGGGGVTPK